MMKKLATIYTLGACIAFLSACTAGGDNPGIEYAPNMYISQGYEPYSQEEDKETMNPNNMTMRLPVKGTVARGQVGYVYPYPNSGEGYEASAAYTANVAATKANVKEGERLYNIYCWHCHGKKGDNKGPLMTSGKFPPPPWAGYQSDYIKEIPEGKIYHTITYGKGLMGSHAHMLSPEERWKVIHYVKYLSLGSDFKFDANEKKTPAAATIMMNGRPWEVVTLPSGDQELLTTALGSVTFKMASSELKAESKPKLDEVARYLNDNGEYKAIISGHAGVTLKDENAEQFALDRAKAVTEYLIGQGVDATRLMYVGYGNDKADTDVVSADSRKKNRRVEILIVK
jgi:outer membrane protein OmpA-like peptidoglycan-associated protein